MKNLPEIDPEVRGLLEEIVADPRSSIRLVPRKPLKSWFDSGETVSARDVSGTKAERHLIEAHREALAKLLCDAAMISFWKTPSMAPLYRSNGVKRDMREVTNRWSARSGQRASSSRFSSPELDLLRHCIAEIPANGSTLALASLGLVPSDRARYFYAVSLPATCPRTAIAVLRRLASPRRSSALERHVLESLGTRLTAVNRITEAREFYQAASAKDPTSFVARLCTFNLSCLLGDECAAITAATEIGSFFSREHPAVLEAKGLFLAWWRTRSLRDKTTAKRVSLVMAGEIPEAAQTLCEAFEI